MVRHENYKLTFIDDLGADTNNQMIINEDQKIILDLLADLTCDGRGNNFYTINKIKVRCEPKVITNLC